ncbi:hypothetical protein Hte_005739 [Hypoxylon texense]
MSTLAGLGCNTVRLGRPTSPESTIQGAGMLKAQFRLPDGFTSYRLPALAARQLYGAFLHGRNPRSPRRMRNGAGRAAQLQRQLTGLNDAYLKLAHYPNVPGTVMSAFRDDPVNRVVPYDLKKTAKKPKVDPDEARLPKYEVDRRSIFVGDLPASASSPMTPTTTRGHSRIPVATHRATTSDVSSAHTVTGPVAGSSILTATSAADDDDDIR